MKIEKIKVVKPDFAEGSGPSETVTLGFRANGRDFILGTFYFGPGMQDGHAAMCNDVEAIIDAIAKTSPAIHETNVAPILRAVTDYAATNTCLHEETHRGGVIWEICDHCGMRWADDEGGKPADAHDLPNEIEDAYELLSKIERN